MQRTQSTAADPLRQVDALIALGLRLARTARSGRVALAKVADAIEPAWIPRPWGEEILFELQAAQESAREPVPLAQVERALRGIWGLAPAEVLDELEAEPIAVTPGAQVHRGALEGRPVAVKVLRPGLATSVRQDLVLLELLMGPLGAAFPALDARAVVHEIRERVLEELDLGHEATTMRWFHRALRGHPYLTVPAPVTRLSEADVLVSEWVEGVPLWQADDPNLAAERLMVFVLGSARAGIVHADPDPADVLVMADGRLGIVDFGATRAVEKERLDISCAMLDAFLADDLAAFAQALEALGWLPSSHAETAMVLVREALGELAGPRPVRLDNDAVIAARDRLLGQASALAEVLSAGALPPEDIWPARAAAQLFGTIARVGATASWAERTREALRSGWEG